MRAIASVFTGESLTNCNSEGSIGKEGPSAGIAILTAFVSLFSKKGISSDLGTFSSSSGFGTSLTKDSSQP